MSIDGRTDPEAGIARENHLVVINFFSIPTGLPNCQTADR
jgi:hypothetical protein